MTMDPQQHVDGNAIGGLLIEVFGQEMTAARGCCDACGSVHAMGALIVFRGGPGDVVRCLSCGTVVLVISALSDGPRVYLAALRWFEAPSRAGPDSGAVEVA
jgi:hypothetical protein